MVIASFACMRLKSMGMQQLGITTTHTPMHCICIRLKLLGMQKKGVTTTTFPYTLNFHNSKTNGYLCDCDPCVAVYPFDLVLGKCHVWWPLWLCSHVAMYLLGLVLGKCSVWRTCEACGAVILCCWVPISFSLEKYYENAMCRCIVWW